VAGGIDFISVGSVGRSVGVSRVWEEGRK